MRTEYAERLKDRLVRLWAESQENCSLQTRVPEEGPWVAVSSSRRTTEHCLWSLWTSRLAHGESTYLIHHSDYGTQYITLHGRRLHQHLDY